MGKVVDLNAYKTHAMEQRSFGRWRRRFNAPFNLSTRVTDLADEILLQLATPGDESTIAFYDLIMGALGLGPAQNFQSLDSEQKMAIVDIHLFLADQVRFEMLHRLGWIQDFGCRERPLFKMVISFQRLKAACGRTPPEVSVSHPGHVKFQSLIPSDRASYIRRLLPEALDAFKKKIT